MTPPPPRHLPSPQNPSPHTSTPTTPTTITPLNAPFAHRLWTVVPLHGVVTHDANLFPNKPWEAICGFYSSFSQHSPTDPVPQYDCSCGFYLFNNLNDLVKYSPNPEPRQMYTETYYWGRVIVHEDGVRAQFVYPRTFYLNSIHDSSRYSYLIPLLEQYNVEIVYAPELYLVRSPLEQKLESLHPRERKSYMLKTLRRIHRQLRECTRQGRIIYYQEQIEEITKLLSKYPK